MENNEYVPFLINSLDSIVRGKNILSSTPLAVVTFFTPLASIVLMLML